MSSLVSIWNSALSRIGHTVFLQSPTEKGTEQKICAAVWDLSLEATLSAFDWSFARKRAVLADLGSPPDVWAYRYAYPTDCIKARYLDKANAEVDPHPFEIVLAEDGASRNLLANVSPATLVYTANVTNTTLFDSLFTEAITWKLGAEIGIGLAASKERVANAKENFKQAISIASASAANEGQNREQPDASHIRARD